MTSQGQAVLKPKWHRYADSFEGRGDTTGRIIIALDGHGTYDFEPIKARIFVERARVWEGLPKERRYFPQVDDDDKEVRVIVGDERRGYRTAKEAKAALLVALQDYQADREEG